MIANQETLAALVQFFNTAFTSGESDGSFGDLSALPEGSATDFYSPQPDVSSNAHNGASAVRAKCQIPAPGHLGALQVVFQKKKRQGNVISLCTKSSLNNFF